MPGPDFKRSETTYVPTGPTVRAALDFATKTPCFKGFGAAYAGWSADEMRKVAIGLFEDRKVTSATFSFVTPEMENYRQLFVITFTPLANGYAPTVEIEIKSVEELRTKAKLYKSDATAYAGTRKPKRTGRAIDDTL
jgi:hypothetical protein